MQELHAGVLYAITGVFIAEGWQLVISSLNVKGVIGLVLALAGLGVGAYMGENVRKQRQSTPLFWFSFTFHMATLGFSDTILSGFVSMLIVGSGLPSLLQYLGPDPQKVDIQQMAPMVVSFFVGKGFAVAGLGPLNKTALVAAGIYGMLGYAGDGPAKAAAQNAPKPARRSPSGSDPSWAEAPRTEPAEAFLPSTSVDESKYTPNFLAAWREVHKDILSEIPEELATLKLNAAPAPSPKGRGRGKKGEGKGEGKGKGNRGKGKGFGKGDDGMGDFQPEVARKASGIDDGTAEVGDDIRWSLIAEEMARIDAQKKPPTEEKPTTEE